MRISVSSIAKKLVSLSLTVLVIHFFSGYMLELLPKDNIALLVIVCWIIYIVIASIVSTAWYILYEEKRGIPKPAPGEKLTQPVLSEVSQQTNPWILVLIPLSLTIAITILITLYGFFSPDGNMLKDGWIGFFKLELSIAFVLYWVLQGLVLLLWGALHIAQPVTNRLLRLFKNPQSRESR